MGSLLSAPFYYAYAASTGKELHMSRYLKSDNLRYTEKRRTGEGADYIPWIKASEFNSGGTCVVMPDYKNGRTVQLLSQGEARLYYILRFDEKVADIREQFPLDLDKTLELADAFGIRHPKNRSSCMTTDMLVTLADGSLCAYSVKSIRKTVSNARVKETLFLEKQYWEQRGIPFKVVFASELSWFRAENIRLCSYYWDPSFVTDGFSAIKHLIIHHKIEAEMDEKILDFRELIDRHKEEIDSLLRQSSIPIENEKKEL